MTTSGRKNSIRLQDVGFCYLLHSCRRSNISSSRNFQMCSSRPPSEDSQQDMYTSPFPEGAAPPRYMPSLVDSDPICTSISGICGAPAVGFDLLDSRWNGNEVFRYDLDTKRPESDAENHESFAKKDPREKVFAKINRVESPSVFMSEAVSLTMLVSASDSVNAPRPLHVGKLPRVGEYGPGAFMLLDWFDLAAFGALRTDVQKNLANMLADIHLSEKLDRIHCGRFGFTTNNYLALTPMDNTWMAEWPLFFAKRFVAQVNAAFANKSYGRAPLNAQDEIDASFKPQARRIVKDIDRFFEGCDVRPSLLHGDLWIGNVGATKDSKPVIFDPASFFGHSEFDLALMRMFGGYSDTFWSTYFDRIPKAKGFDHRAPLYELFQYLNQLNLFGDPQVKVKVFTLATALVDYLDGKPMRLDLESTIPSS